ncbi:alpha-L-fucosidase [Sciscionella sediminilitoris]|uniref:alpha-L-fucosidase n=1 Tax=Sciscionella sediminilitoris TaxID=1445613 RepID=UPI0009EA5827|nr:alpha-L-fucosidase [Sciscionella sp. SE31]
MAGSELSRRTMLAGGTAGIAALLTGAPAAAAPVHNGPVRQVAPGDPAARRLAKAAHVAPRPEQLAWQRREITAFTHFGMNTFTDREWGSGTEDEAWFAPDRVEIEQWMRAYASAGAKQVMLTVKHHDGFVLYPSRYTNHSIIASPWWTPRADPARDRAAARRGHDQSAYWQARRAGQPNPQGDLLRSYVDSARRNGLRVGVYLSPADGAELPHDWHAGFVRTIVAKHDSGQPLSIEEQATYADRARRPAGMGRYGDRSPRVPRPIPTPVPGEDRAPWRTVTADNYNAYYLNQLYELLTEYGPIDELWLDGANPWRDYGIEQEYDFAEWFRLIAELSPSTLVFGGPAGIRWVGNEDGIARETEWSVIPTELDPRTAKDPLVGNDFPEHDATAYDPAKPAPDIASRAVLEDPRTRYLEWFPAEADVCLRGHHWFWHAGEQPKTVPELLDRYETTVGRNAVLLLNAGPDVHGRIEENDVRALAEFGTALRTCYGHDLLAETAAAPRETVRALTSGRLHTAWRPGPDNLLELGFDRPLRFDRIRIGEDITHGQRVESFAVHASTDGVHWSRLAEGTTIGYARILPVHEEGIRALRLEIGSARARPRISSLGLYLRSR